MNYSVISYQETDATQASQSSKLHHRKRSKLHYIKAYCTVIGGFIYMMFPGSLYILQNLSPYIASYYKIHDSRKAESFLPAMLAINVILMPIGTKIIQRNVNPHKIIFSAGFLIFILLNAARFAEKWIVFFILYGLSFVLAQIFTYMAPIHSIWHFFPK